MEVTKNGEPLHSLKAGSFMLPGRELPLGRALISTRVIFKAVRPVPDLLP